MKKLLVLLLIFSVSAYAGTAFLKHDYVSGQNRVCVYDYLGSEYVITIKAYKICPMTIKVD